MSVPTPELAPAETTTVLRAVSACPSLVLLPVPVSQPPYDDEVTVGGRSGPLLVAAPRTPVGPLRALTPLRLVPPPVASLTPVPVLDLPPVRPVAHALVQGLLEVLAGVRSVAQLKRRTSTQLYEQLEAIVHAQPRIDGLRPGPGAVRSVHVQEPAPGVAEVCATVRRGSRAGAFALRLEHVDGAWCCTAVAGLPSS